MEKSFFAVTILCAIYLFDKQEYVEAVYPGVQGNLALLKFGFSSSKNNSDAGVGRAVNGDMGNTAYDHLAATKGPPEDNNPWLCVNVGDNYLIQNIKIVSRLDCCLDQMETLEARVGTTNNDNFGNTNELCGEPVDMNNKPSHVFRCEIYGRYINLKKTNTPVLYGLAIREIMVNVEPTTNVAFGKNATGQTPYKSWLGPDKAVDGKCGGSNFLTKWGYYPPWLMIDFGETMAIVKIFLLHSFKNYRMSLIVITIGADPTNHGQNNPKFGDIHDFSKEKISTHYLKPRMSGRYASFESLTEKQMAFRETEFYSESMPFIEERTNGFGSPSVSLYNGLQKVLPCHSYGYPPPYIAWVNNGVVLQNRSSDQDTNLVVLANGTKGTMTKYECWASNVHGKDLYVITATHAGRYDMCIKPEEVKDPSRSRFSKQDATKEIKDDKNSFDITKMYSFFNPLKSLYMKLTTSCPSASSCGTDAPGWLPDGHPKPEDGIVNRKVCFHHNGDCCYKALYIDIINCPGMFVYGLVNTVFDFSARYCFDDDKSNQAFLPFKSVPRLFTPVGGPNTALVNHIVAKVNGIEDTTQCMTVCMMNKCRSFNFDKVGKICEVNDVTRDEYPRDLTAKPGFRYYHPMGQSHLVNNKRN